MKLRFTIPALLVLAACSTKPQAIQPPKNDTERAHHVLYVVNHGWHTGFIVPAVDLFDQLPWLGKRFASIPYLEFGWGDEEFYQARKMTTGLTLKSVFWPTPTVMRVAALPQSPKLYDAGSGRETCVLCLTDRAYQSFIAFLQRSFSRDAAGNVVEGDRGLYGNSQFYRAVGQYSLFNTCNTWTAKGLQSAGIALEPTFKITASSIMHALKTERTCQARTTPAHIQEPGLQGGNITRWYSLCFGDFLKRSRYSWPQRHFMTNRLVEVVLHCLLLGENP